MSCWETNSAILREQYPGLLEELLREDAQEQAGLNIGTAASGAPTLVIQGRSVHSPRDPEREGRRLAEASVAESAANGAANGPVVVLGFGLGYAAQAIAELAPARPIIIVEKNISLLRKAFELRDFSRLLLRPGIAFLPGGNGEGITTALSLFEKSALFEKSEKCVPHVMRNRTLTDIDEQWYASVEGRMRNWAMRDDINRATLKKFGKRWVCNLSRNMDAIRDLPGVSRLAGLAADPAAEPLPVFLAAAGPGLDGIAHLLPEIRKRCIIVAVDTSLRFLLRNGATPDFVLVVDPQFWNNRHLDRCESPHTRLVAESAVYPPVLRLPFAEKYLCGSLFPLGTFIEQQVDPKGPLGAGGSVATTAWDFARSLGARQIWIAGLDLAFPGLKTHCKGARFEEKALAESARLNPAETWLLHALRDGGPFTAPAIDGGKVLTDRRLSLYASWFESRFRQFPHIRNYGLVARLPEQTGGLAIPGLEPASEADLLALPPLRAEIDRRLEAASSRIRAEFFEPEETQRRADRYKSARAALLSGLEHIQDACAKGEKIAAQALKQADTRHSIDSPAPAGMGKTLAALDAVNRSITDSAVKDIAGFLFPQEVLAEMAATVQPENETAAFRGYLASSLRLYRSLAETANSAKLGIRELGKSHA